MLSINQRKTVRTRYEFAVPSPATKRDIADALFLAATKLEEIGGDPSFDDSLMVEAQDDEIVVWFDWREA